MPKYVTRMAKSGESESYAVKDTGARDLISAEAETRAAAVNAEAEARAAAVSAEATARQQAITNTQHDLKNNTLAMTNIDKATGVGYVDGYYRYYSDGEIRQNENYAYSTPILVMPGSYYSITGADNVHTTFYDKDMNFISGTLGLSFMVPNTAIYMIVSIAKMYKATIRIEWQSYLMQSAIQPVQTATELNDFDNAEYNRVYVINYTTEGEWQNVSHYPVAENGTLITIGTNGIHWGAKQIYLTNGGRMYQRIHTASAWMDWTSVEYVKKNETITNNVTVIQTLENGLTDFDEAELNKWYIINLNIETYWDDMSNYPIPENGTLITLDSNAIHYGARQIYLTITGKLFTRFYAPTSDIWSSWESTSAVKKKGVLYDKKLDSTTASEFLGTFETVENGFKITAGNDITHGKFYSIERRRVQFLCTIPADAVVTFGTKQYTDLAVNTKLIVDMGQKTVQLQGFAAEACPFLTGGHIHSVELLKEYQHLIIRITDMNTGDVYTKELVNNGTGCVGPEAIGTANNVPPQWDFYYTGVTSGSPMILHRLIVACKPVDVVLYGDSISDPEYYWPTSMFENSWTQLFINKSHYECASSGRSGCNISQVLQRIPNELPYLGAKYCVVTIGTNEGNTVERLKQLVKMIRQYGCVPILNHIPCWYKNGDTDGYQAINAMIDEVRESEGVKGCDFDLCTSLAYDGSALNPDTMWHDVYPDEREYRMHPNEIGCWLMFEQLQMDVPEIF